MSIAEGLEFSVLFRPTRGTHEVFSGYEEMARTVGVTHLQSRPAVRRDPLRTHMAGKPVPRVRLNRHELEDMTIFDVARPVEFDSKRTRALKSADGIQADNSPIRGDNTPIKSPIEDVELKAAVCN